MVHIKKKKKDLCSPLNSSYIFFSKQAKPVTAPSFPSLLALACAACFSFTPFQLANTH